MSSTFEMYVCISEDARALKMNIGFCQISRLFRFPGQLCRFRTVFNKCQSYSRSHWFYLASSYDRPKKSCHPLNQPIRCKAEANRDLVTHVFTPLQQVACLCSQFLLAHRDNYLFANCFQLVRVSRHSIDVC